MSLWSFGCSGLLPPPSHTPSRIPKEALVCIRTIELVMCPLTDFSLLLRAKSHSLKGLYVHVSAQTAEPMYDTQSNALFIFWIAKSRYRYFTLGQHGAGCFCWRVRYKAQSCKKSVPKICTLRQSQAHGCDDAARIWQVTDFAFLRFPGLNFESVYYVPTLLRVFLTALLRRTGSFSCRPSKVQHVFSARG